MENNLYYYIADTTDPYLNIAREEHFLLGVPLHAVILYLWQNEKTVVIGRNQCAWRECRVEELKQDGGHLARRLSGGGAVYHDLGNLNFTFLYPQKSEDIAKQTAVVADAVASFGLQPKVSGRNDITIDGRKFSGNAYYAQGDRAYHHGTIMLNVDPEPLSRYLNVHRDKYRSKGVDSVRSRVVNLQTLCANITVENMKKSLIDAFERRFGGEAQPLPASWIEEKTLERRRQQFAGWDWIYGRPIACTWQGEQRFDWGLLRAELSVDKGVITDCGLYTDAMRIDIFRTLEEQLIGMPFEKEPIRMAVQRTVAGDQYGQDCLTLLNDAF